MFSYVTLRTTMFLKKKESCTRKFEEVVFCVNCDNGDRVWGFVCFYRLDDEMGWWSFDG